MTSPSTAPVPASAVAASPSPPPASASPSPWDAHAAVYEVVWERSTSLWGCDALVLGRLPSGARFLDVACGSGSLALTAASLGFGVTATDLSPGMIDRLKAKIAARADASTLQIAPRVVDGQTLEGIADASFDVVSSIFGIFLFPDREAAWKSALRVLTPGGRLVAASWDAASVNVRMVRYLMENAADRVLSDTANPLQQVLAPAVNRTVFADTFKEELQECGFVDVRIHKLSHSMCFTSGEELVRGVLDNSAFLAMLGHKQEASLKKCILEYAQLVLDGVDPFDEEAKREDDGVAAEQHPLWAQSFALQAVGLVAVASKPRA